MWIRNTDGRKDAVLTLTLVGFVVVVIKLLLAGSSLVLGADKYTFGDIDAAEIMAILTPTLGAYVSRRYTDRKYHSESKDAKVKKEAAKDAG